MDSSVKGIGLFSFTMLICAFLDMVAKYIIHMAPAVITSSWRYLLIFSCSVFFVLIRGNLKHCLCLMPKDSLLLLRGIFQGLFGGLQLLAITMCPLSIVISIIFTMPLFLLLFSRFLLKEDVKFYQWVMVIIGFIGVGIIIRPSGNLHFLGVVLALLSMLSYCMFQVITRKIASKYKPEELMFSTMSLAFLINLALSFFMGHNIIYDTPFMNMHYMLPLLTFGIVAYTGNIFIIRAFSLTKASVLAPFNYLQLALTLLISVFVFQEKLDMLTWVGILAIMLSGIGQSVMVGRGK